MIIGMAAVTYVPRMVPLIAFESLKLPGFLERVLKNVPYAVLGALIFPGVRITSSHIAVTSIVSFSCES